MVPTALRLVVDWVHIREAERRGRRVTPLGLALAEQTRFQAGHLSPEAIVVVDSLSGAEVRFAPHPTLSEFHRRFMRGEPVEPSEFVLEPLLP